MEIIPFDQLRITTITVIVKVSEKINFNNLCRLLYVTKIDLPKRRRKTSKFKIPHYPEPGHILSVCCGNYYDGPEFLSRRPFKNAITIDLSTKTKNVSIKISTTSIQMCGVVSEENGNEALNYLLEIIEDIRSKCNYISQHQEKAEKVCKWIYKKCRKDSHQREIKINKDNFITNQTIEDYTIKVPDSHPRHLDPTITSFFLKYHDRFRYLSEYTEWMKWVIQGPEISENEIKVVDRWNAMVNYNYKIGFKIKRAVMRDLFDGYQGFYARYDNSLINNLTIEYPCQERKRQVVRKKKKIPCHTFIVYQSGLVTQSGPGGKEMEEVYYKFCQGVNTFAQQIQAC